jgi:hypothetical protein
VTDNVATGLILPLLPFIALKLGVGAFAIGPRSNPGPGRPAGAAPAESDEPDVVVAQERVAP